MNGCLRSSSRWLVVAATLSSLELRAVAAVAEDARPENVAAARALALEGVKLADAGRCDAAVEKFERAEALYHAPSILSRLGECQIALGKLVLGTETLNKVIREPLDRDAPKAFRDAQRRARRAYDAAMPRIAKLTVNVAAAPSDVVFRIDGVEMEPALLGVPVPVDPGERVVVVSAPGHVESQERVELGEGQAQTLNIELTRAPEIEGQETAPPTTTPKPPPPMSEPSESSGRSPILAYTLLGVGAAGLAAGGVFGVLALNAKADLDDKCPQRGKCDPRYQGDIDSANRHALVSTIGVGVGAVCALSGTLLLLTGNSSTTTTARRQPPTLQPWVGFSSAGVSGSF